MSGEVKARAMLKQIVTISLLLAIATPIQAAGLEALERGSLGSVALLDVSSWERHNA
jgi:hypothetical protein